MHRSSSARAVVLLVGIACTDRTTGTGMSADPGGVAFAKAQTGEVAVNAATSGSSLDPDGYTVTLDDKGGRTIGVNGTTTFKNVLVGDHLVALSGVAGNCTVAGGNPRTITVADGVRATTTFSVTCVDTTGSLSVTTATTGENLDPDGYAVSVDGRASGTIGTNGTLTLANLAAGDHSVALTGVAANCTVGGENPRTVSVVVGTTASTNFSVTCTSTVGDLQVSAATTGESLDPDGYVATVDGTTSQSLGVNGTVTFAGLAAGSHTVSLGGVAGNCTVSGANPQTVSVVAGATTTAAFSISCAAASASPVIVMAGDIAGCTWDTDEATAKLLDVIAGPILALGDNTYPNGTAAEFTDCYGPTWGRHKARIHPIPGNHEYNTTNASGYFGYFGPAAGDPSKGYYSFDVGSWHIIMMNSECPPDGNCSTGSAQETWLKADLQAHPNLCTLVAVHKPRFHSNDTGGSTHYSFWTDFYNMGVDVVVSGDYHWYERFAPMTRDGVVDLQRGIRQFIIGTGGTSNMTITSVRANSEVRNDHVHGVLKMALNDGSYAWEYVPVAGDQFSDSGSWACH